MDWANTTLRTTRINVARLPDRLQQRAPAASSSPRRAAANSAFAPMDQLKGIPLTNWARGNYGAVQGATDPDHILNGVDGSSSAPFPGMPKCGIMGLNYGVEARRGHRRPLEHRGRRRAPDRAQLDGHPRHLGPRPGDGQPGRPRQGLQPDPEQQARHPPGRRLRRRRRRDAGRPRPGPLFPNAAALGMGFNCGGGMYNSGGQSRSLHPGGVNAGFADGSVNFIKDTVAHQIW